MSATAGLNTGKLADTIAKKHNLSKASARQVLNTTLETIQKEVKKGRRVTLAGFGTFERGKRKARKGRNPQTGEQIKIKATKYPKFRPGSTFRESVR